MVDEDITIAIINILYVGGKVEESLSISREAAVFKIPKSNLLRQNFNL